MLCDNIGIIGTVPSYSLCLRSIYLDHAKNGVECIRLKRALGEQSRVGGLGL